MKAQINKVSLYTFSKNTLHVTQGLKTCRLSFLAFY